MKQLMLAIVFISITGVSIAQDKPSPAPKKHKSTKMMMQAKDHTCTDACKEGKHVYKHGEKGHVCTDACKKI